MINLDQELQIIKSSLPHGFFDLKSQESKFLAFCKALAKILNEYRYYLESEKQELNILKTQKYLQKWENFLGLPDETFNITPSDLNDRLTLLMIKFAGLQATTIYELENLFVALNINIDFKIKSAFERCTFPLQFPIWFSTPTFNINDYIFIQITQNITSNTFPLAFPMQFGESYSESIFKKIIQKIKPFNQKVIIEYFNGNES